MRKTVQSKAILASAGFGKTYQLAHRYIGLLASGCDPRHICAVTFSRKAAGEIFDSIVGYLREAASDPKKTEKTAKDIGIPGLKADKFYELLREFLRDLHRNHIGTLDSFTVSVIRAFPLELGISPNLELMDNDGSAARLVRNQVLARVFNRRYVPRKAQIDFHEAYKQATFGRQEKNLVGTLNRFITSYWEKFQSLPDAGAWGTKELIWPEGSEWLEKAEPAEEETKKLEQMLLGREFPDSRIGPGLVKCVQMLADCAASKVWNTAIEKNAIVRELLAVPGILAAKSATIEYYRHNVKFDAEECRLWAVLLRNLIGTQIRNSVQESSGIGRILAQYEKLYDPILRSGRMTFADAQYLLTPANEQSGGAYPSRRAENRLYIDYRLDCELDHWLIDEFQDTSNLQWEVIRNLIDEIMQDPDRGRSFFYVGDVKQAVHGWRGGNAALFGRIQQRYGVPMEKLKESHRSCRHVLNTVNRVFEELPESVAQNVRETWGPIWVHHVPEPDDVPDTGYTALIEATPTGDDGKCLAEDRFHAVARAIKEIDPVRNDFSVAVLVRTNEGGKQLVDQLRRECPPEMTICHEGRARIVDNPVVGVLLALVRFAAHPGDTLAWRHVQMSPLGKYLDKQKLERENLPLKLLEEINTHGFEMFVRRWGARLALKKNDKFGRKRVEDLAAAAAVFDEDKSRDCGQFLGYIADHEVEESGTKKTVKVMTIHKSKGLTFDVVILPEMDSRRSGKVELAAPCDPETNRPRWVMRMPVKFVSECDHVLSAIRARLLEAEEFEELCVLYVGMTRPRYAVYMVVNPDSYESCAACLLKQQLVSKDDDSPVSVDLDGEKFICLHENGEAAWYARGRKREKKKKGRAFPVLPAGFAKKRSKRRALIRVEPSVMSMHGQKASSLFRVKTHEIMDFGSAIHELLEQVGWHEDADVETIIGAWRETSCYEEDVTRDVITQFRECMEVETVKEYLARPEGNVELWREKRFEIVLDNKLISGIFDRVTIVRDDDGCLLSALVLDYKSSIVDTDAKLRKKAEEYRHQLALYGRALSRILELDPSKIKLQILFTRLAKVYDVE